MAGGIWKEQNKVRPGAYVDFTAAPRDKLLFGERGILALPLKLSWGAVGEMITVEASDDERQLMSKLGYTLGDDQLLLLREALKRARKVLVYRVNGGEKAKLEMTGCTATAKYPGVRGNSIAITVLVNDDDETRFDVQTWVDGVMRDEQKALETASELIGNDWVEFSGSVSLLAEAGGQLTGGSDAEAVAAQYGEFLAELEALEFHCVGLPVDDTPLKALFTAFVMRLREQQGIKVTAVMPDYAMADYEGVISVKNGVVLKDGTVLPKEMAVAWVAGATAAAELDQSLTYAVYPGAERPDIIFTDAEIREALTKGELLFSTNNGRCVIEQDINSLITYTVTKPVEWHKNRVVRTLDGISMDISRLWHLYYIGQVDNSREGRALFKADIIKYLRELEDRGGIDNFDADDILVDQGIEKDAVVLNMSIQPVDAMEKLYMTVEVR